MQANESEGMSPTAAPSPALFALDRAGPEQTTINSQQNYALPMGARNPRWNRL
jgi:hypothetical protein